MAKTYSTEWFFEREFMDGTTDKLSLLGKFILSQTEGVGSVPVEYYTQQSALGDGVRVTGFTLAERNLIFTIINLDNISSDERDRNRMRLLDFARPNQYKPVKAVVTKDNGKRYFISIYPAEGAVFGPDGAAGLNFQEPTTWVSYNPIWYEYDPVVIDLPLDSPDIPESKNVRGEASINGRTVTFSLRNNNVPIQGNGRYLWNFGDGSFSTEHTAVHLYADPGTYQYRLTASNESGSYSSNLVNITVA